MRHYTTVDILSPAIDQIVITYGKDELGVETTRVRAAVQVTLNDDEDILRPKNITVNVNKLVGELNPSVAAHITAIKAQILTELQKLIA